MQTGNCKTPDIIVGKQPDFSRPVVFLDFDGVINLGGHYKPPEGEARHIVHRWRGIPRVGEWQDFVCNTIHMSYYQEVADALRSLNCVWISSWKNLTQSKLNPMLGFDFGYVDWKYRGLSDWGQHGKALGISKAVKATGGCDWIVVDDDMWGMQEALEYETGCKGTVIVPDPLIGLTEGECARLVKLARS